MLKLQFSQGDEVSTDHPRRNGESCSLRNILSAIYLNPRPGSLYLRCLVLNLKGGPKVGIGVVKFDYLFSVIFQRSGDES